MARYCKRTNCKRTKIVNFILRAIHSRYPKCVESYLMLLNWWRWFWNSFQNHSSVIRSRARIKSITIQVTSSDPLTLILYMQNGYQMFLFSIPYHLMIFLMYQHLLTDWLKSHLVLVSYFFSNSLSLTAFLSKIKYFHIFIFFLFYTSWPNACDFGYVGVTVDLIGHPEADLYQVPPTYRFQSFSPYRPIGSRSTYPHGTGWTKIMIETPIIHSI